jgi:hypothetical protein
MPVEAASEYLAALNGAAPDMAKLHELGVPLSEAVAICESHHKAPEPAPVATPAPKPVAAVKPLNLACYMAPPAPAAPAPKSDAMDGMSAMSMLHTLCEMAVSGQHACFTTLRQDGFSESTSRELVKIINASLATQRTVRTVK